MLSCWTSPAASEAILLGCLDDARLANIARETRLCLWGFEHVTWPPEELPSILLPSSLSK